MARSMISNSNFRGNPAPQMRNGKKRKPPPDNRKAGKQDDILLASFGQKGQNQTGLDGSLADITSKLRPAIPLENSEDSNSILIIGKQPKDTKTKQRKKTTTRKKSTVRKSAPRKKAVKNNKAKITKSKIKTTPKSVTAKKAKTGTAIDMLNEATTPPKISKTTKAKKTTAKKAAAKKPAAKKAQAPKNKKAHKQPDLFPDHKKAPVKSDLHIVSIKEASNNDNVEQLPENAVAAQNALIENNLSQDDMAPLARNASVQLYRPNGMFGQIGYWLRQSTRRILGVNSKRSTSPKNGKRKIKPHEMLDELNRLAAENNALKAKIAKIDTAKTEDSE